MYSFSETLNLNGHLMWVWAADWDVRYGEREAVLDPTEEVSGGHPNSLSAANFCQILEFPQIGKPVKKGCDSSWNQ